MKKKKKEEIMKNTDWLMDKRQKSGDTSTKRTHLIKFINLINVNCRAKKKKYSAPSARTLETFGIKLRF